MKKRLILTLILLACTVLHLQAADSYDHLMAEARQAKYSKEYEKALKYYDKAYNVAKSMRSKYRALSEAASMLMEKKDYPGAHTHIIIGVVVEENDHYIAIQGRSFHFARIVDGMRSQVTVGQETVRVIPWGNVELIHWLTERTDWNAEIGFDVKGSLILQDTARTMIAERRDGLN